MKVAIIGSRGQLGSELVRHVGNDSIPLSRFDVDLRDGPRIVPKLLEVQPDAVINTAAYTRVDEAERDQATCQTVNAEAVKYIAKACRQLDAPLVQISTDYVFGGRPDRRVPYTEEDPVSPQGIYAKTKWAGECYAAECPKHFVVRTSGLYGTRAPGSSSQNFVDTMLRLARERDSLRIVDDQYCTPTYIPNLAAAILFLMSTEKYGTYHLGNRGETTWYDFAAEIFRIAKLDAKIERVTTAEFGAPAPRPAYSVLDTSKYHKLGGPKMPSWQAALREYLGSS